MIPFLTDKISTLKELELYKLKRDKIKILY